MALAPILNCLEFFFWYPAISDFSLFRLSRFLCDGVDCNLFLTHTNPFAYLYIYLVFLRGAKRAENVQNLMVTSKYN
jgi:hypothetical protein